ncbi:MAG: tetratricopeptide repeat protein [Eubacteriales bacterium]|nr:tetratricopeptide repeat protein [Eubacteriales bacterium]
MRALRNILLTMICIAAIGAGVIFGYFQFRGNREKDLLTEGLELMEQGNYRLAREKLAEASRYENSITRHLATDSLEEDLYKYVAICDFRLGELEEAASIYDRLLRLHPKDPLLLESRATVYAATGQMEEAVNLFDTAIAIDDKNYSHIYSAALTLREYGNADAGRNYLEKLLTEHGEEIDALTRGQALCFLGRYQEAEEVLSGIQNPDMQTSFMLASAKEYNGKHEEALAILEEYEEEINSYPEMLDLKGTALCGLGRYEEAMTCFEQALPRTQDGTALKKSILFNRIAALEHLRQFDKAKELAAEYSQLYPDDARMNRENLFLQSR